MTTHRDYGKPFAVVASQRTGSTLLVRSLDASPRIFCAGEIFHAGGNVHHGEWRYREDILGSRKLGRFFDSRFGGHRAERHLERFYSCAGKNVDAVGFKVMASQMRLNSSIMPALKHHRAALLFLYRRDSFATAISYYKAKSSGIYHSDRATKSDGRRVITADADSFGKQLEHCENEKAHICDLYATHGGTLLAYEDMIADWDAFIKRVGAALGIDGLEIPTALDKLDSATHGVTVANEHELRQVYSGRLNS